MSTLHVWITFCEYLLHISCRREIKNNKHEEKKIKENDKIRKKIKTSSKLKWVVWSNNLSLEEAEHQTTEMQLEVFFLIIENLLELLVSTKVLSSDFM